MQTDAEVRLNGTHLILIDSEGFQPVTVDLDDLSVHEDEKNTTASLVRGVAAAFQARGCKLQGFDAKISSTVLPGSGLSSSAAFEVLIGRILNGLFFENKLSAIEIAQIGQYAENVYFGKPSGLMDQMASSVGGLVFIDFADPKKPVVEKVDFDFAHCGHTLCIIDSHASHADLTDEYAAIPVEMKKVAAFFGKEVLNDVEESAFYASLPALRASCGDRAVLRAMHYFEENQRVRLQVRALRNDNFGAFLTYVNDSGRSSWLKLQNVTPLGAAEHQDMAFTLALCKKLLDGEGAVRIHGGGFAGTALAFVPLTVILRLVMSSSAKAARSTMTAPTRLMMSSSVCARSPDTTPAQLPSRPPSQSSAIMSSDHSAPSCPPTSCTSAPMVTANKKLHVTRSATGLPSCSSRIKNPITNEHGSM